MGEIRSDPTWQWAVMSVLPCAVRPPVRGSYVARRHRSLWVLDKENGGKADALNAGVNAARHPYVCALDADALVEPEALLQVAAPILDDPDLVVATGGIVRIANGCTIDHGLITDIRLPAGRLAALQVIEYFRAFLIGRVGWTRFNALLIISGAFGLFQRTAVEETGGYWTDTVGEDAELVVRIHRHFRDRAIPYRVVFVPDPVCWTEAPEDLRTLSRQRRRWQRGLGQTIWRHRRVVGRPRYGAYAVAENVGFRQLNDFWRLLALVDLARRTQGWGAQQRRGIGRAAAPAPGGRQPRGS